MYKKKYLIGIYSYDRYELCEAILEDAYEFSEYIGAPVDTARVILSQVFHHQTNYIIIEGRRKFIEFINTTEIE